MNEKYSLPIEIETDEDGICIASCATFKACHADGKTIAEALFELGLVIEMCMEEHNIKVPFPNL